MSLIKTKELRWLVKTFPELKVGVGYIPLKEWIGAEIRAWRKEVLIHKCRQQKRNIRLVSIAQTLPNKGAPESESSDLTL